MKKLLPLLTLCMGLCCVSCYDDSPILERLDALEKNAIASINEQISAIKSSITSLEAVDKELKATIQTLEAKDASQQGEIDKLREADASLETKIGELKTYVDEEISNTEDWATATFATIEQYNEIVKELSSLKEVVESNYATLDKKIDDSIESIKTWVNEALKSYYTSEEVDELLNSLKDDLDALQAKLDNLLRDFIITFDDSEIGILAGGRTSVGYTITGATEKTIVKALGQNGWSAKVTPNGTDKGTITVTAPNPLTEDEIIVLVYDGEYRTIMSSINFVTGVVTPSQTAVELEAEAGTIDITVTSNLNYQISIPEDAKDWLSVIETKSMSTNTITFAYSENTGVIRSTSVSFKTSETIAKINFIQSGSALEVTVSEVGTLKNQISDSMSANLKGLIVHGILDNTDYAYIKNTLVNLEVLDISDISNTTIPAELFKDNKKITRVNLPKALTEIPAGLFRSSSIKEVQIPNTVEKVRMYAFYSCYKLSEISLNEGLTEIEEYAYQGCSYKGVLTMPNTLTRIGSWAFSGNRFSKIIFSENLEHLSGRVFDGCGLQGDLVLPDKLRSINVGCFSSNNFSGKLILGKSTSWIGQHAFSGASTFDVVYSKNPTPPDFAYLGEEGLNKQHLVVPIGSLTAYKEHRIWGQFLIIEEADI